MEKIVIGTCIAILVQVIVACGFKEPVAEVVSGNFDFSRGDYDTSMLEYFRAMKSGLSKEYIRYNLGNVYEKLGESDYAAAELKAAFDETDPELLFRAHFNLGNIYFGKGEYRPALEEYKAALRIKPASGDAKKNLEIAAKKIENEEKRRASSASGETRMTSEVIETLKSAQDREVYVWKYAEQGGAGTYKNDW